MNNGPLVSSGKICFHATVVGQKVCRVRYIITFIKPPNLIPRLHDRARPLAVSRTTRSINFSTHAPP